MRSRVAHLAAALAGLAALASTATAARADERPIALADAIAIARAGNDTRAAQAVEVERARARIAAADGADDLVLEAGAEGLTRMSDPVAGPFFQETALDGLAGRVAAWKPLPWGGRVGVQVREDVARTEARLAAGGPPTGLDYTVHGARAELIWMQPLLRGRGRAAHDAPRRLARAAADAEAARLVAADDQLVLDVTAAYWELAYAAREVAIRDSALALAREQLAITRARTEVGRGSELEVLAVEQAIAAREAARIAAEQARDERALELRVLLALDDGDPRALAAADALDAAPGAPPTTAGAALARALARSPALRALAHQDRAAAVRVDAAARDSGPRLDLVVRGGPTGTAATAGDAWSRLGHLDGYEASAALSFALPVGDRTARAERAAASLERTRVAHERDAARGRLTAAVQRAVDAVVLSERRIAAASQAATLAARNVVLEQDRWRSGLGTNFDVLTRQDQAAAADAALARAHADRQLAHAALRALTGE